MGTIEVDDATRRLIGKAYGYEIAPRAICRRAILANGTGWLDQLQLDALDDRGNDREVTPDGR